MKLAEALIERAELKVQIAQLQSRMKRNAKVQEGENPAELISDIVENYELKMSELEVLIKKNNLTNSKVLFDEVNHSISDAIAKRDCIRSKENFYRDLRDEATQQQERYSRTEIKFVRQVDVKEVQSKIDSLAKEFRTLDTKIQAINWITKIVE